MADTSALLAANVTSWLDGVKNFYQAHLVPGGHGLRALTLDVDALKLPRIALVKIGAEGHELPRLPGSSNVLRQKSEGQYQ